MVSYNWTYTFVHPANSAFSKKANKSLFLRIMQKFGFISLGFVYFCVIPEKEKTIAVATTINELKRKWTYNFSQQCSRHEAIEL